MIIAAATDPVTQLTWLDYLQKLGPTAGAIIALAGLIYMMMRRRSAVVLRVHRAYLLNGTNQECFFINLTNHSPEKVAEITHVWIQGSQQIPVIQPNRPLPHRLKPHASWETWIPVQSVPADLLPSIFGKFRARLTTGKVLKSKKNKKVPDTGHIPG